MKQQKRQMYLHRRRSSQQDRRSYSSHLCRLRSSPLWWKQQYLTQKRLFLFQQLCLLWQLMKSLTSMSLNY